MTENDEPLKEDELHLWVGISGDETGAFELVVRFDEFEQLEIGFSIDSKDRVYLLSPNQWKMLQAFIEHSQ